MLEQLREGLSDLYQHWNYRKHLKDSIPDDETLADLLEEAEAVALNLLVEDGVP
jgi:hypothetical protein